MSKQGLLTLAVLLGLLILSPVGRIPKAVAAGNAEGQIVSGRIRDSAGAPVAGAMITISHGSPFHSVTVFSDDDGHYRLAAPSAVGPYNVRVRRTGWICGANSDSIWRFDPSSERFTNFPLPTRVTFTREIDFDEQGRIWTSNSNIPAWQIEGACKR
jgi:hypothetical protein